MLSIVVALRNDDHGENMLHRTQIFLDGLTYWHQKFDWDIEIIIVEWNPPEDQPRLREVLLDPDGLVRYIEVPPEIHNELANSDVFPLYQMIAKNVGIRRARGKWILATNPDLLFTEYLAWFLSEEDLQEDSFYRVTRFDTEKRRIPLDTYPAVPDWIKYCEQHIYRVTRPAQQLHTAACGDFTLLARDQWHKLRGYPEWPIWSTHIDGVLLSMAFTGGLKQAIIENPARIYHLAHTKAGDSRNPNEEFPFPRLSHAKHYNSICQMMIDNKTPWIVNDENWGFADCEEEQIAPNAIRLMEGIRPSRYQQWISVLRALQARPNYNDQTPESLEFLAELIEIYKPTKIIELGVAYGLSLRTWIYATEDTDIPIVALDYGMQAFQDSLTLLPIPMKNPKRISLQQGNALTAHFLDFWNKDDRVLFYIDIHGERQMWYLLQNVVPLLPTGSIVAIDDLWYSPKLLTKESAQAFRTETVLPQTDPGRTGPNSFAPYWGGGSFMGYPEVKALMKWTDKNEIPLRFKLGVKTIYFIVERT